MPSAFKTWSVVLHKFGTRHCSCYRMGEGGTGGEELCHRLAIKSLFSHLLISSGTLSRFLRFSVPPFPYLWEEERWNSNRTQEGQDEGCVRPELEPQVDWFQSLCPWFTREEVWWLGWGWSVMEKGLINLGHFCRNTILCEPYKIQPPFSTKRSSDKASDPYVWLILSRTNDLWMLCAPHMLDLQWAPLSPSP